MGTNKPRRVLHRSYASSECPVCGNPGGLAGTRCEKCGELLGSHPVRSLLEVDVAHGGESWEEAREKIIKGIDRALVGRHKGLKIIHGRGQTTGRAVIRTQAIDLLNRLARQTGGRLQAEDNNPGAHILWLAD